MRRISASPFLVVAALAFGGVSTAEAQDTSAVAPPAGSATMVDQIAAVVGDSIILATQVVEQVQSMRAQGDTVTAEVVLDELIKMQLILQSAARDTTLVVNSQEIDQRAEAAMEQVRSRFPSSTAFDQALAGTGLTPATYRAQLREQLRKDQIRQMFLERQLRGAPSAAVTEAEMRQYYQERRATLQERPELLTVQQVFVEPGASDSAWTAAQAEADSLHARLVAGADFEELATAHSEDPGSAAQGGDLGWFRRGVMVREFEQVAFRLRDGQTSPPVRSPFGYHIIKVERSRPGEVKARHILVMPELSPDDESRARARAETVADRARAGESMSELSDEFGDADQPKEFTLSRAQVGEMPYPGYAEALASTEEGEIIGPFRSQIGNSTYFVVLKVVEIRQAGEFTFEDVRDQIRQTLLQQKQVERVFQRLREATYVDIRM